MQQKIGTILDKKLLSKAKAFCQKTHTTLSGLFESALSEYLQKHASPPSSFSSVETSFGALKVSPSQLKAILEEDIYES